MDDRIPTNLRCSALVFRDDLILLCQRSDGLRNWVLPGGTPHDGESLSAAVSREVVEETGINVSVDRVAFVLDTTNSKENQHLVEIVFTTSEFDTRSVPRQLEHGLMPSFVALDELNDLDLLPPIAGYVRGLSRRRGRDGLLHPGTASYLGNLWRQPPIGEVTRVDSSAPARLKRLRRSREIEKP